MDDNDHIKREEGLHPKPTKPLNGVPLSLREFKDVLPEFAEEIMDDLTQAPSAERAGCLVKQAVNMFIAPSGSGKSLVSFCLAWKETKEGSFSFTVYLDFDNPFNIYKNRYAKFERLPNFIYIIKNDFKGRFKYLDGINPKDKAWAMLENLALHPPKESWLIVVDNLQQLCDCNDLKELGRFFDTCERLTEAGFTILLIHDESSKIESFSSKGLSFIRDNTDALWEVVPDRDKDIVKSVKLTNIKSRFVTGFTDFIVSFDTDQGTVSCYDQNVLLEVEIPVKDAIIEYLTQHPNASQDEIIQNIKPKIAMGVLRTRAVLEKLEDLHILKVQKDLNNEKTYSIKRR